MRNKKIKTSKHHIIFKGRFLNGVSGRVLEDNIMILPNKVHKKVHELDNMVDERVEKDCVYYLQIIKESYNIIEKELRL